MVHLYGKVWKVGEISVLTNEQVEDIIKSESHKLTSFINTIKYIYRSKSSDKIINLLSKNINKSPSTIKNLIWEIIKYFVISHELIQIRKELFNMMFNNYAKSFDESELMRIINNPSNQWLDYNHKKIDLLLCFVDDLISNPNVCEKVCNFLDWSPKEYFSLRDKSIATMDSIKLSAFKNFEQSEILKLSSTRQQLLHTYLPLTKEEGQERQILYDDNFKNSALLGIEGKE